MARDDTLDKEFTELEREIDAKVDSLFVEMEEAGPSQEQEDPWKRLKELFLTLEWEIEESTLLKICAEAEHLQSRFPEGALGTLLGWVAGASRRICGQGAEVDQEGTQLLSDLKDALFKVAEDPFGDPGPVLQPLRARVERFLVGEVEEAPTVTLEAVGGEDLFTQEMERGVEEEEIRPQERLLWREEALSAPAHSLASAQEAVVEAEQVGEGAPDVEPLEQIDRVKAALEECGRRLEGVLTELSDEDPLGVRSAFQTMAQRLADMARSLESVAGSLREQIQTLFSLDLAPRQPEPEPPPEPEGALEEVLFVSVSNRVFGIPLATVRGVFKVPARSVPQVVQLNEITLRDRTVPLVSLWKKLGLGRALYTFPKEEKRILLVASGSGEVGLLVDQVLARQEILVRPAQEEQGAFFKGIVSVEKSALVVDIEAL